MVVDIVRCERCAHRPFEQLRVIDDRAVEPNDRTRRILAVDQEITRLRRMCPDPDIMHGKRGDQDRHACGKRQGLVDEQRLKVLVR
jgi:hypothetical protein